MANKGDITNYQKGKNLFNLHTDNLTKEEREDQKSFELSIPHALSPYIVHEYSLIPTENVVGRKKERSLLKHWVSNADNGQSTNSMFCLVSMGGMGKTALTHNFFDKIAPNIGKDFAGRFWWSFYEPKTDSNRTTSAKPVPRGTFENFVIYALAYVSKREPNEIAEINEEERIDKLINELNRKPYLIVLDGLERELRAYNRPDLLTLEDEEHDSEIPDFTKMTEKQKNDYLTKKITLRSAIDSKFDSFLKRLTMVSNSKILITSRLLPSILQIESSSEKIASCDYCFLKGLEIEESLELWRSLGATGSENKLRKLFENIRTYPILISILAKEISENKEVEGNYDKWLEQNPSFSNIFSIGKIQEKLSKVLEFSLERLNPKVKSILNRIVEFDMPINYLTLSELAIEIGQIIKNKNALSKILNQLKDRALIGEDSSKRYEVHPVISRVIDLNMDLVEKKTIGKEIIEYASQQPIPKNEDVKDYKDLTFVHTTYINYIKNTLEYDNAVEYFWTCLQSPTRYYLGNCRERLGLLTYFLLENTDNKLEEIGKTENKANILYCIADTYSLTGEYEKAIKSLRQSIIFYEVVNDKYEIGRAFNLLSHCLFMNGEIFEAERILCEKALKANKYSGENLGHSFRYLSNIFSSRKHKDWAIKCNDFAVKLLKESNNLLDAYQSEYALADSLGEFSKANEIATKALYECKEGNWQFGYSLNLLAKGIALLKLNRFDQAKTYLGKALKEAQARKIDYIEIKSHIELAKLHLQIDDVNLTKHHLNTIKNHFSENLSRFHQTEIALISAKISWNEKIEEDAISEAMKAYRLAWCDGNSYSYNEQLEDATKFLLKFNIEVPVIKSKSDNQAHLAELEEATKEPKGGLPKGISNTAGWTEEQIIKKFNEVKQLIDWENAIENTKDWWKAFETENQHRKALILRLAEELNNRKTTIMNFHNAYKYSNTENIQANLHYHDYDRLKKYVENLKKDKGISDVTFISFLDLTDEFGKEIAPKTLKSEMQIKEELKKLKLELNWEHTTGSAKKWWENFENENKHQKHLVLRLAEELKNRKATIAEFFLAYVYSNTENIQANLYYHDYDHLKKQEELRKKNP